MDVPFTLWLFVVAACSSAVGGMLGMAGGIFVVPLLVSFLHVNLRSAIGASLVSVIACSCGSAAPYLRERLTNVRLAIVLETATTLGALCGFLLSGVVPVDFLYALFAAILLLSAQQMFVRRHEIENAMPQEVDRLTKQLQLDSTYPDRITGSEIAYQVQRVPVGMGLMFGAGLISALLGIGSGVLKIPAMDTALRLPIKVSSATSNFMIAVTAAASAGAFFVRGDISSQLAGPVALGSIVGGVTGARILIRMSNNRIRWMFVALLVALAILMVLQAVGVHPVRGLG